MVRVARLAGAEQRQRIARATRVGPLEQEERRGFPDGDAVAPGVVGTARLGGKELERKPPRLRSPFPPVPINEAIVTVEPNVTPKLVDLRATILAGDPLWYQIQYTA